jgi:hypothetical protein
LSRLFSWKRITAAAAAAVHILQAHSNESDARKAADAASEGLRAARIAEMSTTGSMVTLSSLATFDEDTDTLQVGCRHRFMHVCPQLNDVQVLAALSGAALSGAACPAVSAALDSMVSFFK